MRTYYTIPRKGINFLGEVVEIVGETREGDYIYMRKGSDMEYTASSKKEVRLSSKR